MGGRAVWCGVAAIVMAVGRAGADVQSPIRAGATVYVDSVSGNDGSAGTSAGTAWRSLARVNGAGPPAGCTIRLKAGCTFDGPLIIRSSRTNVGRYGAGKAPWIRCDAGPVVELQGVERCDVGDLDLSGGATGVLVVGRPRGATQSLTFRRLAIHDIHGGLTGDDGGFLVRKGGQGASFDGIRIEDCSIEHADRNGILITDWPAQPDDPLSTRVVIRGNRLRDIGGDGIFILGCRGAVIERNVLRYAHQRVGRGPGERACAGIWPQRSIGTLIQFNEVSHTAVGGKTVWDSEAFDDDGSCRGTVFQYNYSHDNAGGFLLNCGGADTVVRCNISQNDATALFTVEFDSVQNMLVANNTFYMGPSLKVLFARNTMGSPDGVRFVNNIVHADGEVRFDFNRIRRVQLERNCLYGKITGQVPADAGIRSDPLLARPGGGGDGMASASAYRLRPGSPCLGAGIAVPKDGGRDFFGAPLPSAGQRSIGASQR